MVVPESVDAPAVMYIDLHLIHEVTSPQAFAELDTRGIGVRNPQRTYGTMDHSTPTLPKDADGNYPYGSPAMQAQVELFGENCKRHGIRCADMESDKRGIVHVMGPELGLTQPGMTIVCGDSHTATHGAFGALAFGIGTTEVGHVLATQCLLQRKPKTMRVILDGELQPGVSAKDLILAVIAEIGMEGGTGHVIEYAGSAVRSLPMEARMTMCNMSIEGGARAGLVAPDDITFDYLRSTPAGTEPDFEAKVAAWKALHSDEGASFDKEVRLDASKIQPMITWGVSPDAGVAIDAPTPSGAAATGRGLDYMQFPEGEILLGQKVDRVFVGSCTNGRLADMQATADVLKGRRVKDHVTMIVVPGSHAVKKAAEAEGLDQIILDAGAEWREPGCSMCIAMNGDRAEAGELVVSTSNRNFKGRQGMGVRTALASPATAAAAAVAGVIADPRDYLS